jgi:hypothetical protein
MNEPKPDGGPAFARSSQGMDGSIDCQPGMSLRDYMAGRALQGVLSNPAYNIAVPFNDMAKSAYGLADAMLKERDKP